MYNEHINKLLIAIMATIPKKYLVQAAKEFKPLLKTQFVDTSAVSRSPNLATVMNGMRPGKAIEFLQLVAIEAALQCQSFGGNLDNIRMAVKSRYQDCDVPCVDGGLMMCFHRPMTPDEIKQGIENLAEKLYMEAKRAARQEAVDERNRAKRIEALEAELTKLKGKQ